MYLGYYRRPSYKFFSILHHPVVSMIEYQEAQDASTSTSCQSKPQWGWQREDNNYNANNIATSVSIIAQWRSQQCGQKLCGPFLRAVTTVEQLWQPSSRVHLDNANSFVIVFLWETQSPPPPLAPPSPTLAMTEFKQPVCLCYTNIRTSEMHDIVGQAWVRHLQSMYEHNTTRNDQCMSMTIHAMINAWAWLHAVINAWTRHYTQWSGHEHDYMQWSMHEHDTTHNDQCMDINLRLSNSP